jgi:restriction system protein
MAIPGYQEFMLALLKMAADGREHTITDAIDVLADQFDIPSEEREVMLASGTQTRLYNRVTWALTYLTKSLLIEKTGRGRFTLAPRGAEVLQSNPSRIDNSFLMRFDEFRAFKSKKNNAADATNQTNYPEVEAADTSLTPLEQIEGGYRELTGR